MIYERGEFGIFPAKLVNGLSPNLQVVLSWLIYHTNTKTKKTYSRFLTSARSRFSYRKFRI